MSTTDSPWGDTGFDSSDDGFRRNPSQDAPPPAPGTLNSSDKGPASADDASAERLRIEPIPVLPKIVPPSATQRRSRSLMWIAVLALGALLVAGGGVAWYLSSNSVQEEAFIASDDQEDAPRQAEPQQPDESIQQQAALDSAAEQVVDTTLTMPRATKHTTAETLTKQATPIRQPKQPPTPEPRKQPVPDISQSAVQSEQTALHVERLNVEPETKTSTDLKVTKSKPSASEPAWVVQVFASPSRDDAEEWLQQLREQRIPDGYIVEQKVKGQSWYRVRFGQFPSRAEAEQAAQTRGFAQPWIARVR